MYLLAVYNQQAEYELMASVLERHFSTSRHRDNLGVVSFEDKLCWD